MSNESIGSRLFPTVVIGMHVLRKPWFILRAVVVPLSTMAFLTFIQFTFRYEHMNDRVTAMLTLVLTSAASKLATQDYLPKLAYSTLLDRYVFGLDLVILGATGVTGFVSLFNRLDWSEETKLQFEFVALAWQLALWLGICVWFGVRGVRCVREARATMVPFPIKKASAPHVKLPSLEDPSRQVNMRRRPLHFRAHMPDPRTLVRQLADL